MLVWDWINQDLAPTFPFTASAVIARKVKFNINTYAETFHQEVA